jgi:uncharacterized Zn finger protein (UPF0148 family)
MKTCPKCGAELVKKKDVIACPNRCDMTTARGPDPSSRTRSDYDSLEYGSGCYIKNTKYTE